MSCNGHDTSNRWTSIKRRLHRDFCWCFNFFSVSFSYFSSFAYRYCYCYCHSYFVCYIVVSITALTVLSTYTRVSNPLSNQTRVFFYFILVFLCGNRIVSQLKWQIRNRIAQKRRIGTNKTNKKNKTMIYSGQLQLLLWLSISF